MKTKKLEKNYRFIVVGGGMSGICAAIAAARGGIKTALIHNRPVLGGNASSEVRMHICGADNHGRRIGARETGIIEEILLENKYRNPHNAYPIFDAILWEKTHFQENLDLFLNTHMTDVNVKNGRIQSVEAIQLANETDITFFGDIFCDTTGDGTLAYLAGAEYMSGREARHTYNESHAPEIADSICMGNTLLFKSIDMGHKVDFIKPNWANNYTEDDLVHRDHGASGYNYWWIELGGDDLDTISDNEIIRDELLKATYGVWDHIKNSGYHQADNYALDWMGFLPGKRESRRVYGDYVLNENDLANTIDFDDAIAYGGWPMDMHVPGGLKAKLEPTDFIQVPEVYQIPYRSIYSKNIENLFIGGRTISASHMAFGSIRVMATCGVIGQAIGTAARFMPKEDPKAKDLLSHIEDLQNALLKDDAYLPRINYDHPLDLAKSCSITASSECLSAPKENIIDGQQRTLSTINHHWESLEEVEPWIQLNLENPIMLSELRLKFDSDLTKEIRMSMFDSPDYNTMYNFPSSMVKDYKIQTFSNSKLIDTISITDNRYRLRVHKLNSSTKIDALRITCQTTYGDSSFKLIEASLF